MTTLDTLLLPPLPTPPDPDTPRTVTPGYSRVDRIFRGSSRGIGVLVLVLTGSIGVFLGYQLIPTLHRYGFKFFTETQWLPAQNILGLAAALVGTIEIAAIALVIAFPLAITTALFISEYAPRRIKPLLVTLVDLMAAVPSLVYGLWGRDLIQPHALFTAHWVSEYFSWIPFFKVTAADPHAAYLAQSRYEQSAFIAGMTVAMMVIPLATAVMRNVFDQAPIGEREAALALGSTRWGVIRSVVLPFGRGGIVGGTMLGLGRALGETVAVLLILQFAFQVKIRILETGTVTISSLIANDFQDAGKTQLSALLAAGFVLFLMTLVVNTIAAIIVNRSRSGAGVDA